MKFNHAIGAVLMSAVASLSAFANEFRSPEVLMLGDSQLLFGSGETYLDFFENIDEHCSATPDVKYDFKYLKDFTVGLIGVRSTSLTSWVRRDEAAKKRICQIDSNWPINARIFGSIKVSDKKFLQIGQKEPYRFCENNKSAFEVMFGSERYKPKLFIMSFLGNSAKRWADSLEHAKADAHAAVQQMPDDLPCIFMTTVPTYREKSIELRLKAQKNLHQAFEDVGHKCSFVKGLTVDTIKANLGNNLHFKTNQEGKVKDPFHPNAAGTSAFLSIKQHAICKAIAFQMGHE